MLEFGLRAATQVTWKRNRGVEGYRKLVHLVSQTDNDLLNRGLEILIGIQDERVRATALWDIGGKLEGELLDKALAAVQSVQDEQERDLVLAEMMRRKEKLHLDALIAEAVRQKGGGTTQQALEKALNAIERIEYESDRAESLALLSDRLFSTSLERALLIALEIQDNAHRATALAAIARVLNQHKKQEVLSRALDAVLSIDVGDWARAEALARLAGYLEGGSLERALDEALRIEDSLARAGVLAMLFEQIGDADRRNNLIVHEIATAIQMADEEERFMLLLTWLSCPVLTEETRRLVRDSALETALTICEGVTKIWALWDLVTRGVNAGSEILEHLRMSIADTLLETGYCRRGSLLELLACEFFGPPVLTRVTLGKVADHIIEICWEWQWQ